VPDSQGEWFEVLNPGTTPIDINGWTIRDDGADTHAITNGGPLIVPPGGRSVLGRHANIALKGGYQAH